MIIRVATLLMIRTAIVVINLRKCNKYALADKRCTVYFFQMTIRERLSYVITQTDRQKEELEHKAINFLY